MPGTLVLIGGDPGIGKSTLVLQAAAALAGVKRPGALRLGGGIGTADQTARRSPGSPLRRGACSLGTDLDEILASASAVAPRC